MLGFTDWKSIQNFVNARIAEQGEYFTQGKVIKRDVVNKLIWLKEFGDQPIPLVAFNYQVKYYIVDAAGKTVPRQTKEFSKDVQVSVPQVGEVVLVARMMGSARLPKCLGVIQSTKYVGTG